MILITRCPHGCPPCDSRCMRRGSNYLPTTTTPTTLDELLNTALAIQLSISSGGCQPTRFRRAQSRSKHASRISCRERRGGGSSLRTLRSCQIPRRSSGRVSRSSSSQNDGWPNATSRLHACASLTLAWPTHGHRVAQIVDLHTDGLQRSISP